jgi:hypothetical protein
MKEKLKALEATIVLTKHKESFANLRKIPKMLDNIQASLAYPQSIVSQSGCVKKIAITEKLYE